MKKGKPRRNYEEDGKTDNKIKQLQKALKKKEEEIRQLRSQVDTLEAAFKKAAAYMSKESQSLSVEELIKAAEKNLTLEQAKKSSVAPKTEKKIIPTPPSKEELERKKEEARQKALEWRRKTFGTDYEEE